jgi:multidrug resistance protein MdtO
MVSIAQTLPTATGRLVWYSEFLRNELAPYPGRASLVARMVITSTVMMIISMTFRVPYGAYAAIYALVLSRESLESTTKAAQSMALGLVLGGAHVVLGALLFSTDPMLRFLWVVATFFLIFWVLSALSNYGASARFGYLIVITTPLWDRHISAEMKVENTLWAVGSITIASGITLLLEMGFAGLRRVNDVIDPIADRLSRVEELLACYAHGRSADPAAQSAVTRLAMVGTSRLRQTLSRSNLDPQDAQQMGAVVALIGRLVDLTANLAHFANLIPEPDRKRISEVAERIARIRKDLVNGSVPRLTEVGEDKTPSALPLLNELEKTVSLIPDAFAGSPALSVLGLPPAENRDRAVAVSYSALFKSEHVKFGLRGCLAASLCYTIYNALFWPEIATAVTTCFLTALTTIGASRQKQILRFAGALIGGGIGIGVQVLILPYIDSIGAFTILFGVIISVSAWFATSSPRLAYFGVQVAVAFCLINLQEFKIQTSLAVARDRAVGVLLGLIMMWLFFDQLWSIPAGLAMKEEFVANLRLLAKLAREPIAMDIRIAIERSYELRERINAQFDKIRSLADGVLFEFGANRQQDLALRDRVRRWQPELRTLFILRIASLKYRLQLQGFDLPLAIQHFQNEFDECSARTLDNMAAWIESNGVRRGSASLDSSELRGRALRARWADESPLLEEHQSFRTLIRRIENITTSLNEEITGDRFV